MKVYGSIFMESDRDVDVDVHQDAAGKPTIKLDTLAIHLPDEAKLVELQDHIAAYLAKDDSELDTSAAPCATVGQAEEE